MRRETALESEARPPRPRGPPQRLRGCGGRVGAVARPHQERAVARAATLDIERRAARQGAPGRSPPRPAGPRRPGRTRRSPRASPRRAAADHHPPPDPGNFVHGLPKPIIQHGYIPVPTTPASASTTTSTPSKPTPSLGPPLVVDRRRQPGVASLPRSSPRTSRAGSSRLSIISRRAATSSSNAVRPARVIFTEVRGFLASGAAAP